MNPNNVYLLDQWSNPNDVDGEEEEEQNEGHRDIGSHRHWEDQARAERSSVLTMSKSTSASMSAPPSPPTLTGRRSRTTSSTSILTPDENYSVGRFFDNARSATECNVCGGCGAMKVWWGGGEREERGGEITEAMKLVAAAKLLAWVFYVVKSRIGKYTCE
ncbi:hypothetical protein QJS10_CPB19g01006 [Acorus calamus]|uniref:Uncharacterized protein n=1 Tax=Acorus calamus TaxID=4465 RepID=A0AAV9CFV3_ACOCL|nr:hypothetical protein QJS10_CPB19g01006 [Acorus calamus]